MDQLNKLVTNVNCLLFSTSPRSGSAPTSAGKPPTSSGVRGDHCCSVGVVGQFVLYFGHLNYSNESEDIALYRDYMYRLLFINNSLKQGGGIFRVWFISSDSLKIQVSVVV